MTWMSCQMSSYKNIRLTYAGKCCWQGPRTIVQLMVAVFDYDRVPKMPNKCTVFLFRQHQHLNNKSISNSNYKHFLLDLHLSHFHGLWREGKKLEKRVGSASSCYRTMRCTSHASCNFPRLGLCVITCQISCTEQRLSTLFVWVASLSRESRQSRRA